MLEERRLTCQIRRTGSAGSGNSLSIIKLLGPEATTRSREEREWLHIIN